MEMIILILQPLQIYVESFCRRCALTIEGHVFNKAHFQRLLLCQSHKVQQLVLIEPPHDYAVDLERAAYNNWLLMAEQYNVNDKRIPSSVA